MVYRQNIIYEFHAFGSVEDVFSEIKPFKIEDYAIPDSAALSPNSDKIRILAEFIHLQNIHGKLERLEDNNCSKAYSEGQSAVRADVVLILDIINQNPRPPLFYDIDFFTSYRDPYGGLYMNADGDLRKE